MIFLNPYVCIIKSDASYHIFVTAGVLSAISEEEKDFLLEEMPCDNDVFIEKLGVERFRTFVDQKIIIFEQIPVDQLDSVNRGWFANRESSDKYRELQGKKVLILGCGGLGTNLAWNMAALGIREMILVDDDVVETSNLNRQLLYDRYDVGFSKVERLKKHLLEINEHLLIHTVSKKIIDPELDLTPIIESYGSVDLVVKAIDTPVNHLQIFSEYFHKMRIPYVSGSTVGHMMLFGPTYHPNLENKHVSTLPRNQGVELIKGKGISLPMIMQRISAEVASEALRLLLGKYDCVKYNDSIKYEDILEQKEPIKTLETAPQGDGVVIVAFLCSLMAALLLQHFGMTVVDFLFQFSLSVIYGILDIKGKLYFLYLVFSASVMGAVQLFQSLILFGTFHSFFQGVNALQSMGIFLLTVICFNSIVFMLSFSFAQQFLRRLVLSRVLIRSKKLQIVQQITQAQIG